jgi:hypothetical protein
MRHTTRIFSAAGFLFALAACSHLRRQDSSTYGVTPAGHHVTSVASLAADYGCTAQQVADNWQLARLQVAQPGTPICKVLGRYGDPISVSKNSIADMELVSMLHRQPNGRYYNATFVYYSDTKVNRQLNRPVGKWVVDRVTATR